MRRIFMHGLAMVVVVLSTGCTFNFDVTSQRTALENQVMGSYRELDDDLILASSVRGVDSPKPQEMSPSKKQALDSRQNQQFNRDDVEEFKDQEIAGEAANGTLTLLPSGVGRVQSAVKTEVELAKQILDEENRDRAQIWQRIIDSNPNLSAKDLPQVRQTYAKIQREAESPGQWYEDDQGHWVRKPGVASPGT